MDPNIWGKHGWLFLHSVTLAYPNNPKDIDKDNIKNFFNNVGHVLPCHKCRINFEHHLKKYPLTNTILSSRDNLVKWLIDIHNEVNISTNKPVLSYEDAISKLMVHYNMSSSGLGAILLIVSLISIIIIFYIFGTYKSKSSL